MGWVASQHTKFSLHMTDGDVNHLPSSEKELQYGYVPANERMAQETLTARQREFKPEISTELAKLHAMFSTRLQSRYYLSGGAKKKVVQEHEKPVLDEYEGYLNGRSRRRRRSYYNHSVLGKQQSSARTGQSSS